MLPATVTRNNDVAILRSHAGVFSWAEIRITTVAGEPDELAGQRQPISFRNPTSAADILAGALLIACRGRLAGEFVKSLDALCCDTHTTSSRPCLRIACVGSRSFFWWIVETPKSATAKGKL